MGSTQETLTSRRSEFVDRWSRAEIVNARLGIVLIIMLISFLGLLITLIYLVTKPKSVYYVPSATTAGVAYAQTNSKAAVAVFSASWVLNWSNFTPANVEEVYKRAERFMSPHLLNQTKTRLKKDVEQVKSNNISSLFSISQEPLISQDQQGFNVIIQGEKGIYMGKEEIKLQKMIYQIYVKSSPPTDWNPYGLIVEDISQQEATQ